MSDTKLEELVSRLMASFKPHNLTNAGYLRAVDPDKVRSAIREAYREGARSK